MRYGYELEANTVLTVCKHFIDETNRNSQNEFLPMPQSSLEQVAALPGEMEDEVV